MALHLAEHIMVSLLATLKGLTTTGNNVIRGRVYSFDESIKNAITLSMGPDTRLETDVQSFDDLDSELIVYIDSHVKSVTEQIDTQLNLIRTEITIALALDYTQGGLVIDTTEIGSDEPELTGDGSEISGTQRNTFLIHYRRKINNPTVG